MIRLLIIVVILLGSLGTSLYSEFGTQHTVRFTVQSLDDQATSKGHQYMVFATDGSIYVDKDAWLRGKTDSSNVWSRFQAAGNGATWKCPVYGWRIMLLSKYPNILDGCTLVSAAPAKAVRLYPTPNGQAPLTTQLTQTSP